MPAKLGQSWYLTQFAKEGLPENLTPGSLLFTSAHIQEEQDLFELLPDLIAQAHNQGLKVIVDVDHLTPAQYNCRDIEDFQTQLDIDMLRLDDGFDFGQQLDLASRMPIALNASTLTKDQKEQLLAVNPEILFIHNFYPRPETGLDRETFASMNEGIPAENLVVFIPGDQEKRGPIYAGLPTLEDQRYQPPYVSFIQLKKLGIENILLADPGLSQNQRQLMDAYEDGLFKVPVKDLPSLYLEHPFQLRPDSPKGLKRLAQTRSYGKPGEAIAPENNISRSKGAITQDNQKYGRYSGEVMLACQDYPADEKVNVIGQVHPEYLNLLDVITNCDTLCFVQMKEE